MQQTQTVTFMYQVEKMQVTIYRISSKKVNNAYYEFEMGARDARPGSYK